jgi:hypothetical protein
LVEHRFLGDERKLAAHGVSRELGDIGFVDEKFAAIELIESGI